MAGVLLGHQTMDNPIVIALLSINKLREPRALKQLLKTDVEMNSNSCSYMYIIDDPKPDKFLLEK